jgi:hypothetical protein
MGMRREACRFRHSCLALIEKVLTKARRARFKMPDFTDRLSAANAAKKAQVGTRQAYCGQSNERSD